MDMATCKPLGSFGVWIRGVILRDEHFWLLALKYSIFIHSYNVSFLRKA